MPIRTGILMTPALDEAARSAVAHRLHSVVSGVHVLLEKSSGGPRRVLEELLRRWCDDEELDLIITIGGTLPAPGPSGQESMPEATLAVVERLLPGLPEEMRAYARETSTLALIDRSVAGIRGRTLILNLPAGEGAALLFLEPVVRLIEPILAHLQGQPNAPQLADVAALLTTDSTVEGNEVDANQRATVASQGSKLKADEFAAFLANKKQNRGA